MQICSQLLLPAQLSNIQSKGLHKLKLEYPLQARYAPWQIPWLSHLETWFRCAYDSVAQFLLTKFSMCQRRSSSICSSVWLWPKVTNLDRTKWKSSSLQGYYSRIYHAITSSLTCDRKAVLCASLCMEVLNFQYENYPSCGIIFCP